MCYSSPFGLACNGFPIRQSATLTATAQLDKLSVTSPGALGRDTSHRKAEHPKEERRTLYICPGATVEAVALSVRPETCIRLCIGVSEQENF
jgi:hypothetical protein